MTPTDDIKMALRAQRNALQRDLLLEALKTHAGNISRTAKALHLSRRGLQLRLRALGLQGEVEHLRHRCPGCGAIMAGGAS